MPWVRFSLPARTGIVLSRSHSSANSLQALCPGLVLFKIYPFPLQRNRAESTTSSDHYSPSHRSLGSVFVRLYIGWACVSEEALCRQMVPSAVIAALTDRG